jgi:dTDP-4-amino-4,6-dideoxygalactose transaminase
LYSVSRINSNYDGLNNVKSFFVRDHINFAYQARTCLRLILTALNLKKNAKVGVQAFNCASVFDAIRIAGYQSVFIDINDNYTLKIEDLQNKVEHLDALIINHTFGIPADIEDIRKICGNIPIIEDCAHSLFSTYKGAITGTFFDASIFSIGYGKYPSIGRGGFSIINNETLYSSFISEFNTLSPNSYINEVKNAIRNYLMALAYKPPLYNSLFLPIGKIMDNKLNITDKFGYKNISRFNGNACLFDHNFSMYRNRNEVQRKRGKLLVDLLRDEFICVDDTEIKKLNFYLFPLRNKNRDNIVTAMWKNGIECGKHFANSLNEARKFGYLDNMCPNTEIIVNEVFTIPSHYSITERKIKKIAKYLKQALLEIK